MMRVQVLSSEVRTKSGTSARTGKSYSIREQSGFIQLGAKPFPVEVTMSLEDAEPPYQPGDYAVSEDSFFVGRFNQLQVRLRLDRSSRQDLAGKPKAVNG